jgi:3-hydroxymyristoyl/3-hydroxydecanoyl-(acyl carrier protein) dehydratase
MTDAPPEPSSAYRQEMTLSAQLPHFAGHFPGQPILAGAAQLDALVLPAVAAARPRWGSLRRATRLKFRQALRPGDRVVIHLSFAAPPASPGHVTFRIERGDALCTSGALELEAPAAPAAAV